MPSSAGAAAAAEGAYKHPEYEHEVWLGGKINRVARVKSTVSRRALAAKLFEGDPGPYANERKVLQFLAESSAKAYVVELVNAHDAGTGGDPRSCLILEASKLPLTS